LPFDLRVNPGALNNAENRALLASIFPENIGIGNDGLFLYFLQKTMPPKPWPKTIAGLPFYIAREMGPQHTPMPNARPVHRNNGSIAENRNCRDMKNWDPLFNIIKNHFQDLGISITEVMYWGNSVTIILEHRNTNTAKLPYMAANIPCLYMYEEEVGRPPMPQARRVTDPTQGNPDNSEYDTLQPGLRVTSDYLPSEPDKFLSTTSGVLVRDRVGNEFMTAAAHGFPGECGTQVIHPLPVGGRSIGDIIMEVSHTDVALVKLAEAERFSNVTFQNNYIPEPVQFQKLISVMDLQRWDIVVLDSPDTGCIEGNFMATSRRRVPIDDHASPEQQWIVTVWLYNGQDSASDLPEGMSGSAIWTRNGDVLGFFRYAPKDGVMKDWCVGIAADELINRGFTLVDTANR
jgi:hypothetical protein